MRTEGQAVAETAHRFTYYLVLHPDQLDLLNNPPREAFITGPPGELFFLLFQYSQPSSFFFNFNAVVRFIGLK